MNRISCLLAGAFVVMTGYFASAQESVSDETTWFEIVAADGARLGYASTQYETRDGGRVEIDSQELVLRESGASPVRHTERIEFREDANGTMQRITSVSRAGSFSSRVEARIEAGIAHITRETRGGRWNEDVALLPDLRFDTGDALLRSWDGVSDLAFENFSTATFKVEHVTIAPLPSDGSGRAAMRLRYEDGALRSVTRLRLDQDGRIVETTTPMFGAAISFRVTNQETALAGHSPYRILPNVMTRAPYRISDAARAGHLRFVYSYLSGMRFPAPETGEQRVSSDGDRVTLDICDDCGPGLASDAEALARALRPTSWMQSDDARIQAIARPIAQRDVSDARKMDLLIARLRPYFADIDFSGHYSAVDTLERRSGDCTEAAVLLGAAARAAGIPARVASGLVYSRERYHGVSNSFLPHSWVLAYADGRWQSFDLALEEFDSTHIALTIGDGDPQSIAAAGQLASLLRLDSIVEVRARP